VNKIHGEMNEMEFMEGSDSEEFEKAMPYWDDDVFWDILKNIKKYLS
jgi:hypothetical protein